MNDRACGYKQSLDNFTGELTRLNNPVYRQGVYGACSKWVLRKGFDRAYTVLIQLVSYGLFLLFCVAFFWLSIFGAVLLAKNGIYHLNLSLDLSGQDLVGSAIYFFAFLVLSSALVYFYRIGFAGYFQYEDWRLLRAAQNGDNVALLALYKLYLDDRYSYNGNHLNVRQ